MAKELSGKGSVGSTMEQMEKLVSEDKLQKRKLVIDVFVRLVTGDKSMAELTSVCPHLMGHYFENAELIVEGIEAYRAGGITMVRDLFPEPEDIGAPLEKCVTPNKAR